MNLIPQKFLPNATTLNSTDDCFLSHTLAKLLSGVSAFLAFMISTKLIIKHLRYYTKPDEQRWILRLIFIVPIYSIVSFISLLLFGKGADTAYIYLDSIRSCYEAFVIYSFLSLCFNGYLGGENNIISQLNGKPIPSSYRTLTCCLKNKEFTIKTLRFCKQATLQFCIVKIVTTLLTLFLQAFDLFKNGNFSLKYGYVYCFVAKNISITTALWSLALFYTCTKDILSPYYPLLKFITVKSVIFLCFWQGAFISLLELIGYISNIKDIPKGVVAAGWQNFLTSCEMFIAALAFWVAFSYKPYVPVSIDEKRFENFQNEINFSVNKNNDGSINSNRIDMNNNSKPASSTSRKMLNKVPRFEALTDTLRDSLDPRDIFQDAVHNFSNRYTPYYSTATYDDDEILIQSASNSFASSKEESNNAQVQGSNC